MDNMLIIKSPVKYWYAKRIDPLSDPDKMAFKKLQIILARKRKRVFKKKIEDKI